MAEKTVCGPTGMHIIKTNISLESNLIRAFLSYGDKTQHSLKAVAFKVKTALRLAVLINVRAHLNNSV